LALTLDTVHDGIQDVGNGGLGLEARSGASLVYTGLDEDGVPVLISDLVELVGSTDIRLRSVTDEVDSVRRSVNTVSDLAPMLQKTSSELECANLGLAKGNGLQVLTSDGLVHGLEGDTKSSHAETGVFVGSRPDDIVVREEDWGTLLKSLRAGAEDTALGHEKIQDDLLVTGPVTAVGEDEDGLDLDVGEVASTRVLQLLLGHGAERRCVGVVLDDVSGGDDVLEAIALSDLATLVTFTTDDENGVVLVGHLLHGCVTANKLTRRDFNVKLFAELNASLLLSLATTVCKENVGTVGSQKRKHLFG